MATAFSGIRRLGLAFLTLACAGGLAFAQVARQRILVLNIEYATGPATAEHAGGGIERAAARL